MSTFTDFHTMIYGEDGEKPLRPLIERCVAQAKEDQERMRVEIRTKALGTTSSRQEHSFSVDAEEQYIDTVMNAAYERLNSSPGEGFEGEIRINFYQSGNTSVKYGSFTRQIRSQETYQGEDNSSFMGGNPMMGGMMNQMGGMMNQMGGNPMMGGMNQMGGMGMDDDFSGFGEADDPGYDDDNEHRQHRGGGSSGVDMEQMMQMMQMMQQNQPQVDPRNIVDQKMAMDWLNHTMSFLFRSLSQQMSMFERSTKMIEIYSMRFGLPQPLERPTPERIIREVPMDYPQMPQMSAPQPTPPAPEPSGLGILPTLLQAAAQMAGSPQTANMLKTVGALAGGMGGSKPSAPAPAPQPPQQIQQRPKKRKPTTRVEKAGPPVRHRKPSPPKPAKPVSDTDDFGWESESPPMRTNHGSGSDEFNFGLDGTPSVPINPFGGGGNSGFGGGFDQPPGGGNPFAGNDDFGGFEDEEDDFGSGFGGGFDDEEIELPDDFPDLNGMSADEMKQTVIDWINADPENRKGQIMDMLPELSALIL
jgi:hypothetical protein